VQPTIPNERAPTPDGHRGTLCGEYQMAMDTGARESREDGCP
jgi:hypothetical protein